MGGVEGRDRKGGQDGKKRGKDKCWKMKRIGRKKNI